MKFKFGMFVPLLLITMVLGFQLKPYITHRNAAVDIRPITATGGVSLGKLREACSSLNNEVASFCNGYLAGTADMANMMHFVRYGTICTHDDENSEQLREILKTVKTTQDGEDRATATLLVAAAIAVERKCKPLMAPPSEEIRLQAEKVYQREVRP